MPGSNEDRSLVLGCPVCRERLAHAHEREWLSAQAPFLESGGPAEEELRRYKPSCEVAALQAKMKRLYVRQKANGAIIDVEAENKKFLVTTESPASEDGAPKPICESSETASSLSVQPPGFRDQTQPRANGGERGGRANKESKSNNRGRDKRERHATKRPGNEAKHQVPHSSAASSGFDDPQNGEKDTQASGRGGGRRGRGGGGNRRGRGRGQARGQGQQAS